jgi:hypothetical protein
MVVSDAVIREFVEVDSPVSADPGTDVVKSCQLLSPRYYWDDVPADIAGLLPMSELDSVMPADNGDPLMVRDVGT